MASTLVALQTVTVGAGGSASITFSSIPQTYNDLVVQISVRSLGDYGTGYEMIDDLILRFNGDSSNNYPRRTLTGLGYAAQSAGGSPSGVALYADGNRATSNTFGNTSVYIPNYTSSNYKSVSSDTVTENNATTAYMGLMATLWNNTSAITSITMLTGTGSNIAQYSTFTLYGVYNSALETTPEAPTIGTATAASTGANVAFTPSGTGAPATSYVATSSPGGISATGTTSPILVTGLTSGTAYTFTVRGQNPGGLGAASAASNSVTPYDGYESIATVYVGSATSTVTFSSIPSTYTNLQIRAIARSTLAGNNADNIALRINGDTGNNYTTHGLRGSASTATASAFANLSYGYLPSTSPSSGNLSNTFCGAVIDLLDYRNTNKTKVLRTLSGFDENNASGNTGAANIQLSSVLWNNTSAVTSIEFTNSASFAAGTVFELYGIRG